MAARLREIAEAIARELAARDYPARRAYLPVRRREEYANGKSVVYVLPAALGVENLARRAGVFRPVVQVALVRECRPTDIAAIDAAVDTLNDLASLWIGDAADLADFEPAGAQFVSLVGDPLFLPDWLANDSIFCGVLTLTYSH